MTWHPAIRYHDGGYEAIVGTPEEVVEDARNVPLPRIPLVARCTWCWSLNAVGFFYFPDEPIELDDQTTTTFNDWTLEAAKANHLQGRKRRFHCSHCEAVTDHLADKGNAP